MVHAHALSFVTEGTKGSYTRCNSFHGKIMHGTLLNAQMGLQTRLLLMSSLYRFPGKLGQRRFSQNRLWRGPITQWTLARRLDWYLCDFHCDCEDPLLNLFFGEMVNCSLYQRRRPGSLRNRQIQYDYRKDWTCKTRPVLTQRCLQLALLAARNKASCSDHVVFQQQVKGEFANCVSLSKELLGS